MRYFFAFILLLIIGTSCGPRVLSGKALESKLMSTMTDYLDTTLNPGTKFQVNSVIYYPETAKEYILCHFNGTMHLGNKDTTGLVIATISNDFTTVTRTQ